MLEVYKKGHNYINDIDELYHNIIDKFDKKNDVYFDEINKMKENWLNEYEATKEKVNILIYGNKDGKENHKIDRSSLYEKIVRRSKKWKNYEKLSKALLYVSIIMQIFALINYIIQIFPAETTDIRVFSLFSWISLVVYWLPQSFLGVYSLKYDTFLKRKREDNKWLNNYFKCCDNMTDAKYYLIYLCKSEEKSKEIIELYKKNNELLDFCKKLSKDYETLSEAYKN